MINNIKLVSITILQPFHNVSIVSMELNGVILTDYEIKSEYQFNTTGVYTIYTTNETNGETDCVQFEIVPQIKEEADIQEDQVIEENDDSRLPIHTVVLVFIISLVLVAIMGVLIFKLIWRER